MPSGSLTCMLGSDSEEATKMVLPVLKTFAQKARVEYIEMLEIVRKAHLFLLICSCYELCSYK